MVLGYVGSAPDVKEFSPGNKGAQLRLATNEKRKDASGVMQEYTEWHNISAYNNLASVVEKYVKMGSQIYVEGKMRTREYTSKDGQKKHRMDIVAEKIELISSPFEAARGNKKTEAVPVATPPAGSEQPLPLHDDGNDLPF